LKKPADCGLFYYRVQGSGGFSAKVFGKRAGRPWPAACALAACALVVRYRVGIKAVMDS